MITRRRSGAVLVVGLLALVLSYAWYVRRPAPPALPAPVREALSIPSDRALVALALSRDGGSLAYAAESSSGRLTLILRPAGAGNEAVITPGGDQPFFSPDGRWVAYFKGHEIWKSPVGRAGESLKICDAPGEHAGGAWLDDGRIVFAPLDGRGLMAVSDAGGAPVPLTTLNAREGELAHGWPHALPNGGLVFTVARRGRDAALETLAPAGERGGRLVPAVGQAQYVSTGHLVYSYLGDLFAVAFDLEEMKTRGVPAALAKGVRTESGFGQLGRAGFAASPDGTLAWVRSTPRDGDVDVVKVSYDGTITPLGAPPAPYQTPRLSPDGRRLAVVVRSGMMTREIRVLDMANPDREPLTFQGGDNQSPAWTSDGRLTFASNREGPQKIYRVNPGARDPVLEPLFSTDVSVVRNPASWSAKPPRLAFYEIDPLRGRDVLIYHVGRAILPLAATPANERAPVLSPDGQSVAYVSDVSGRDEVYVASVDAPSDARQLSTRGGTEPVWSRDGLFFREGDDVIRDGRVVVQGFRFEKDPGANAAAYDIDAREKVLIALKRAGRPAEIQIVKNWGTELTAQAPRR